MATNSVNLYDNVYSDFAADVEYAVRHEAYGEDLEPSRLAAAATALLGRAPDRFGLVDHQAIGDAWESANRAVSIVALLLAQLEPGADPAAPDDD